MCNMKFIRLKKLWIVSSTCGSVSSKLRVCNIFFRPGFVCFHIQAVCPQCTWNDRYLLQDCVKEAGPLCFCVYIHIKYGNIHICMYISSRKVKQAKSTTMLCYLWGTISSKNLCWYNFGLFRSLIKSWLSYVFLLSINILV